MNVKDFLEKIYNNFNIYYKEKKIRLKDYAEIQVILNNGTFIKMAPFELYNMSWGGTGYFSYGGPSGYNVTIGEIELTNMNFKYINKMITKIREKLYMVQHNEHGHFGIPNDKISKETLYEAILKGLKSDDSSRTHIDGEDIVYRVSSRSGSCRINITRLTKYPKEKIVNDVFKAALLGLGIKEKDHITIIRGLITGQKDNEFNKLLTKYPNVRGMRVDGGILFGDYSYSMYIPKKYYIMYGPKIHSKLKKIENKFNILPDDII